MTRAMPLEPDAIPTASGVGLGSARRTDASVRVATAEAGELYEAWSARVSGYVRFRVRDASDAEDLVSEVFRRVVTQPMPTDPEARPAWIFRVTHNAVVDYYRRRRFPLLPAGFDRPDDAPGLPDRVIHDERVVIWTAPARTMAEGPASAVILAPPRRPRAPSCENRRHGRDTHPRRRRPGRDPRGSRGASGPASSSPSRPRPSTGWGRMPSMPRPSPASSQPRNARPSTRSSSISLDAGEVGRYAQPADADDPRVAILAAACWPGPLTLVLRKRSSIPGIVTAGLETVGLRVPDHPVAQALLEAAGVPIAAPSANRFGRVSPTRAEHVVAQLDGRVGIVLDGGPCRVGVESTVVLLADGAASLLRPGGTPTEAIEALIGPLSSPDDGPGTASLAPGRSTSHYAPGAPLTVIGPAEGIEATAGERLGLLAADEAGRRAAEASGGPYALVEVLSTSGDPVEQASRLFDALHRLAAADVDRIVAQAVPENGLGRAIMDRLRRAATTP